MNMLSSRKPTVAYVGPVPFPFGGAASRRILGNALALRDAGYHVVVGSGQLEGPETVSEFQGLDVVSLDERTAEGLPTLLKHAAYVGMGRYTRRWLDTLRPRPAAVILYSGFSPYFMRLIPWCRENGVPLVFDAVEWYGPTRTPGGRFGPYRWSFELAMRHYVPRCGNVIAISRYLENYYRTRGCHTLRVPPTLDTSGMECAPDRSDSGHGVRLGYTGTPGNKDLLDPVIEAVLRRNAHGANVQFHVAGMLPEELLVFPAFRSRGIGSLPSGFRAAGKVPQTQAAELVRDCDFTVLLRPPNRDSTAGFPTKFVESMSAGTPVICNLTSDLAEHVRDGQTGLVCRDQTPEACEEALRRAVSLTPAERGAMRRQTREHAVAHFDYRCYVAAFDEFIRNMKLL